MAMHTNINEPTNLGAFAMMLREALPDTIRVGADGADYQHEGMDLVSFINQSTWDVRHVGELHLEELWPSCQNRERTMPRDNAPKKIEETMFGPADSSLTDAQPKADAGSGMRLSEIGRVQPGGTLDVQAVIPSDIRTEVDLAGFEVAGSDETRTGAC